MMLIIVHICVHFLTKILSKSAVIYKKSQSWQDLWKTVKWQLGINNKAVFYYYFWKQDGRGRCILKNKHSVACKICPGEEICC